MFRTSLFCWAQGPWGPGPWSPLGPMGSSFLRFVLTCCKMVRDLSKSVPMVFRSLGKPLIQLLRIFNSKCNFCRMSFFKSHVFSYNCLLVLLIGPCYSLVEEQHLLFPCGRTALTGQLNWAQPTKKWRVKSLRCK